MMKRLRLKIVGLVQGVAFRAYARDEATRLGVTGWVRNCSDGAVEVIAEGPEEALNILGSWCEHGPPLAQVLRVDRTWSEPTGEFQRFTIARF